MANTQIQEDSIDRIMRIAEEVYQDYEAKLTEQEKIEAQVNAKARVAEIWEMAKRAKLAE